ncbi:hypothetical protein GCM10011581_31870 [Saccharopolyspora subtropica]|uniref:Uncharacterized protein n=1 Tax=Saccharopolyspora thermophila TaxID=89367 RepID=A0A917JZT4_9PSEU|nr:hypothetical protein [Saccharopolyspora subtropica]GGI92345.1 hypothetical protein GCM10011581_31870 [Saccharopolyspora subtropica]
MAFDDDVHNRARKIDAAMLALAEDLKRFGVPKGLGAPLNRVRNAVGDVVAKLTMTQRRS